MSLNAQDNSDAEQAKRAIERVKAALHTAAENSLYSGSSSVPELKANAAAAVDYYCTEMKGSNLIADALPVSGDNLVSHTIEHRPGRVILHVKFEHSEEHRQYKMSWRRAKPKIARRIDRHFRTCRMILSVTPITPIKQIRISCTITPEGAIFQEENQ